MKFEALTPMLQSLDLDATAKWYADVLGFEATSHTLAWLRLERDGVEIMFMTNAHLGAPQATATQYFRVDDVMALWERVKPHAKAEWGPEEMPYGMLEFAIRDPNGYLLSFGQEVED